MASDDLANGDTATSGRKRAEKTKRTFLQPDGSETPRASTSSIGGKVHFVGSGEELVFWLKDLKPEVVNAAALFGIMTSVTNTVGKADMGEDEMIEAARARLLTIQDGGWSAERQSGPHNSDLLEAVARRERDLGRDFGDDRRAAMTAKLNDEEGGAAYKAKLLAVDSVRAHFEAIKAERAQERARKAKERAAGRPQTEPEDLADL